MARTWVAHGDTSGRLYLNSAFVESVVELEETVLATYDIRIRMISGAEYYGYFVSEAERTLFLEEWTNNPVYINVESETEVVSG